MLLDRTIDFVLLNTNKNIDTHSYKFGTAAARALMDIPDLSAEDVAKKAMRVASEMCVYTNDNFRVEVIQTNDETTKNEDEKASS